MQWYRLQSHERAMSLAAAAALAAPLLVAGVLSPDGRGYGTHEQLGLAPCLTMQITGFPCAFCGMTTSFVWLVHGHPMQAAAVQPAGACLALALALATVIALFAAAYGALPKGLAPRFLARSVTVVLGGILVGTWIFRVVAQLIAR